MAVPAQALAEPAQVVQPIPALSGAQPALLSLVHDEKYTQDQSACPKLGFSATASFQADF